MPQSLGKHDIIYLGKSVWAHWSCQHFGKEREIGFRFYLGAEQGSELAAIIGIGEGMGDDDLADD